MNGNQSGREEPLTSQFADASNVLIAVSALNGTELDVCAELMNVGEPSEVNVLAITYRRSPEQWMADFHSHFGDDPGELRVIAMTELPQDSVPPVEATPAGERAVETIESPNDLTGLGIQIGEYLRDTEESKWDSGATETVMCFDSVTALLQYADARRVFRFLHLITGRISSFGATAHYHIHPDALDERTLNTIRTLFDGVVRIGERGVEEVVVR